MSKIKQLIIPIIFLSFLLGLTGCATHQINGTKIVIHDISTDKTKMLDKIMGSEKSFAHIVVFTNSNQKMNVFRRLDKDTVDDDGDGELDDFYETKPIKLGSIPISLLEEQSSYSVTPVNGVTVNEQEYRNCNYINVGNKAELICQRIGNSEHQSPEQRIENAEYQSPVTIKNIPIEVVKHIERITGEELPYLVLVGEKKSMILKNPSYESLDTTSKFDQKFTLEFPPFNVNTTYFSGSPCCCITNNSDAGTETCKKRC